MELTKLIEKESQEITAQAQKLAVTNHDQNAYALNMLKAVMALKKKVSETFDPICKKANEAWKEATGKRKEHLDPLELAEKIIRQKSEAFLIAERDRKEKEEAAAREAARKEEEKQRAELDKKIAAANKKGDMQKVADLENQKSGVYVPPAVTSPEPEKTAGVQTRDGWDFKIINPDAVPREYCIPDEKKIRAQIAATQNKKPIPGVDIFPRIRLAVGGKTSGRNDFAGGGEGAMKDNW